MTSSGATRNSPLANYFPPLTIGDLTYRLDHLNPFTFSFHSELAKRTLSVHVTFSNHCFSKAYDPEPPQAGEAVIEGGARPRTFCPVRYRLSLDLPTIVANLNQPHIKVWQTAAQRNWAYSLRIENPEGPYHVFFEVRRAAASKPQDLNLVVESAYHQTQAPPKLFGRMGFMLLCGKVYLRQPTATKR